MTATDAKSGNVDLLCFGEAVLQCFYPYGDYRRDKQIAVSIDSEPVRRLKEIARHNHVALAIGYLEYAQDNIFSSYLIVEGETLCNYRRISPGWKEKFWGSKYKRAMHLKPLPFDEEQYQRGFAGIFGLTICFCRLTRTLFYARFL